MTKTNSLIFLVYLFIFSLIVVANVWWLPQKWETCTKLYDNTPAQILCLNS